jgi:hypothetical protein
VDRGLVKPHGGKAEKKAERVNCITKDYPAAVRWLTATLRKKAKSGA